jgi:hypothetical protein
MNPRTATALRWPVLLGLLLPTVPASAAPTEEGIAFFESRIRPVLAQECYECHSKATKAKGGLLLDSRAGWQQGGDSGDVIVPGKPGESLFLKTIRHEEPDLKMPKAGAKLDAQTIADFTRWIAMGAPDPRDTPPTPQQLAADTDWAAIAKRRAQWWSFQPITDPPVPSADPAFSTHPVDQFVRAAQIREGLAPVPDADPFTIRRRLHYVLTGLPAPALSNEEPAALVDSLLASPAFGERWARHWMDWFRYSEGNGGQGDPVVPNAFEYRDYLIRGLNANVPYDQLVREHLAGDLLEKPRLDPTGRLHESRIGLAHFRFVEHGYFPVDALDELVKFTDNQIDVVTKATLGLTVSCARCHDHKFDAISQKDYYALFGIFASSRPAQRPLLTPAALDSARAELRGARERLATALKAFWLEDNTPSGVLQRLQEWDKARSQAAEEKKKDSKKPEPTRIADTDLLHPWLEWRTQPDLAKRWTGHRQNLETRRAATATRNAEVTAFHWDLRTGLSPDWLVADGRLTPRPAGELGLGVSDTEAVLSILPAGLFSADTTAREQATVTSSDFLVPEGAMAVRWAGAGGALARLAPENFPMSGILYTQWAGAEEGTPEWINRPTALWKGARGYLQISTAQTRTTPQGGTAGRLGRQPGKATRGSWFHLSEVRLLKSPRDAITPDQFSLTPLLSLREEPAPTNEEELARLYSVAITRVLERWQTPAFTEEDALFLSDCLASRLIRGDTASLNAVSKEALQRFRSQEDALAESANRSAPGVIEGPGFDQPLYTRGNIQKPSEPVARAFLSSLRGKPFALQHGSGRLELARELTRPDNPLFARIIANRLWHHVFGQGLVSTPDNFGRTGQQPSHPELLDHLASRLIRTGFDLKDNIRYLLSTRTFRLSSQPTSALLEQDASNRFLTRAPIRRMDAEIIRDHLLSVSGVLDPAMYGPSTPLNAAPENDRRRGIYVQTKREGQNALFASFDVPMPNTTRGSRDVSNTPGQAITLLNSPFVQHQALKWAEGARGVLSKNSPVEDALRSLVQRAFSRPEAPGEVEALRTFYEERLRNSAPDAALRQTAHLVFNLKEFIYLP